MKLAKVLGTVVATEKDAKLGGLRFLMLGVWGHDNKPAGGSVVAVDAVGGELILEQRTEPAAPDGDHGRLENLNRLLKMAHGDANRAPPARPDAPGAAGWGVLCGVQCPRFPRVGHGRGDAK